jgi:hypothetical protein
MNMTFPYPLQPQHIKIIDATFAYCLSQYMCGGIDVCTQYTSREDVLRSVTTCLTTQGLIGDLGYPPTSSVGM